MEQTDPVGALSQKLAAFHISTRFKRLAEVEQHLHDPAHQPKRCPIKAVQQTTSVYSCGPRLPTPKAGKRPCWEPPVLDYSWLESLIEAQKEMDIRDGSNDISWRTDVMDNIVEGEILYSAYNPWIEARRDECQDHGHEEEAAFWKALADEVEIEMDDVAEESKGVRARHGKGAEDWKDLRDRVVEIAREKDPEFLASRPRLGLSTRWKEVQFGSVRNGKLVHAEYI